MTEEQSALARNRAKREQRKRQRERLRKGIRIVAMQRNRARADRVRLAAWIEENCSLKVDREKSGEWRVVA